MQRGSQSGFVLVVVLWALAIMTVLILSFGFRARLDARAATYNADHARAMFLARGAVERGVAELQNRTALNAEIGLEEKLFFDPRWNEPVDVKREQLYPSIAGADYADDVCSYRIEDAERRISINDAPKEILEEIEDISFTTVSRIMRRRGEEESIADETVTPFLAVEEVRFLKGVTESSWEGDDESPGLRDVLTIWGDGYINVNTALPEVLETLPDVQSSVVDEIVEQRAGGDGKLYTRDDRVFYTMEQLIGSIDVSREALSQITRYCKVDSRYFTITGFATMRQGKVRAVCRAVVEVQLTGTEVLAWQEGGIAARF
jgi:type II secretory pathway component PulK